MDPERPAASHAAGQAAQRLGSGVARTVAAFRALLPEQRMATFAAVGLFISLFLPWYQETVVVAGAKNLQAATATLTGWGAFSFVEAAVLLVAAGVLVLLFQRAEGHAFHVPGGDGVVVAAAGAWACVLVIWRIFDKQGTSNHGQLATSSGIEWGIFVALVVAALLTWSGLRIRAAHRPEPPLPGEEPVPFPPVRARRSPGADQPASEAGAPPEASEQLTIPLHGDDPRAG